MKAAARSRPRAAFTPRITVRVIRRGCSLSGAGGLVTVMAIPPVAQLGPREGSTRTASVDQTGAVRSGLRDLEGRHAGSVP
jgi:hypothetical protein